MGGQTYIKKLGFTHPQKKVYNKSWKKKKINTFRSIILNMFGE